MSVLAAGPAIDSVESFGELMAWLPQMLAELLASRVHGQPERPPADARGIYLFSDHGRHMYVGRTGITARARAGKTRSGTSFRSRYAGHTRRSSPPGTAPFATRLMHDSARSRNHVVPSGWWDLRASEHAQTFVLFEEAKERIRAMELRIVAFEDDERGVRSTVAETFVHSALETPYNDFSTS